MKSTLRIFMMLALVSIFGACSNKNSKTNTNTAGNQQENVSIVGKWKGVSVSRHGEISNGETRTAQVSVFEYKEDSTLYWISNDQVLAKRAYAIEGNTLTIDKKTYTITTLTDKKLVIERSNGDEIQEFERME